MTSAPIEARPLKIALMVLHGVAILMLLGMMDVEAAWRLATGLAAGLNLLLLLKEQRLSSRTETAGTIVSAFGFGGATVGWFALMLVCGAERFSRSCDAVIMPLIYGCLLLAFLSVPAAHVATLVARATSTRS